jgi:hypothetical protein
MRPDDPATLLARWGPSPVLHAPDPNIGVVLVPPPFTLANAGEAALDEEVAEYKTTYTTKLARIRMTGKKTRGSTIVLGRIETWKGGDVG